MGRPEHIVFMRMNKRLAATTRFFWEINFPKISQNFDRQQQSLVKILQSTC